MTMHDRILGASGLHVSALSLGTAVFGALVNRDEAARVVHGALDAGINLVDTADVYGAGAAEVFVGAALKGRRDKVILCTKFGSAVDRDPNRRGGSRRWVTQAVEGSLRRLGTDWIDVYQLHRPDPACDVGETLEALTDLVRQGKIRYFGSSTAPAEEIVEAQWTAERRRCGRFVTEQAPYSLLARGAETAVLPACRRHDIGVLAWSPLCGGWLNGSYRIGAERPRSRRSDMSADLAHLYDLAVPENRAKLEAADRLAQLAEAAGLSLIHLALAFVLRHPAVTSAITGPETLTQLEDQLGAVDVELSDDLLDEIDRIVAPGTTVNPADRGYDPPSLQRDARRLAYSRSGMTSAGDSRLSPSS